MNNTYPLRYQATFIVEAKTPLAIGSGDKDILLDNPIIRDAFDLPYIPATSLTGVLRHTLQAFSENTNINDIFGFQDKDKNKKGEFEGAGSRIILSSAHLLAANSKVADGLEQAMLLQEDLNELLFFPIRDHVHINHRGVADNENRGKFESELLARGTRFVFEMELWGNQKDAENWSKILNSISHPLFRIGGGTRKGLGELEVINCWHRVIDLSTEEGLNRYLDKTSRVQLPLHASYKPFTFDKEQHSSNLIHYELKLTARDFFLFDGQFDFDDIERIKNSEKIADMTPKVEKEIHWNNGTPKQSEYKWLIPATSVKGAIAHRVAYHYNKINEKYANPSNKLLTEITDFLSNIPEPQTEEEANILKTKVEKYLEQLSPNTVFDKWVGKNNIAVLALFGAEAEDDSNSKNQLKGQRGRVLFSDLYLAKSSEEKILNHVKIDRYTGGAIDTALFTEKVAHTSEELVLHIYVEKRVFEGKEGKDIELALENTLKDLANEKLPLGGGVMRGHGMMTGVITKKII